MPEERPSAAPVMDQAAWDRAREGVPREMQAARLIVSRRIAGSIPHRPYLMGDSDHAPVVIAVADFAAKVYALADAIDAANVGGIAPPKELPTPEEWGRIIDANAEVVAAMEEFKL